MNTKKTIVLMAGLLYLGCFLIVLQHPRLQADESVHYDQIRRIAQGNHQLNPWITTLPVYHFFMALPALPFDKIPRPSLVRFFSLCTGLLCILTFHASAKRLDPHDANLKAFQFAFFPILFPMFFVIYTDALSLLFILLAFYFTERRNYLPGGLLATLSVAIRQNNVVWLVFLLTIILWRERNKQWLRSGWTYFAGIIGCLMFLAINGAPAIGDKNRHPVTLSAGNIFFFLFLVFVLFLPVCVKKTGAIIEMLQKTKKLWIALGALFVFYMLTFRVSHPYNSEAFSYYLRNRILLFFTSTPGLKMIFFLPIAYALLVLLHIRLLKIEYLSLYPFTLLFLLPSWLIEQRYTLIPFSFLLLLRKQEDRATERFMAGVFVLLSLIFLLGITAQKFFL